MIMKDIVMVMVMVTMMVMAKPCLKFEFNRNTCTAMSLPYNRIKRTRNKEW